MNEQEQFAAQRNEVLRAQQMRWRFLLELYRRNKKVHAGNIQSAHADEVGQAIGVANKREQQELWTYLEEAGLLKTMSMGPTLAITKLGIDEVERAYNAPEKATPHLPPLNVIYNVIQGGIHGSTDQQGTTDSTQTVDQSQTVDWDGLRTILRDILAGADALTNRAQRDEIVAEVSALEAQSRSPRPKAAVVRVCLASLQALVANTAGNIAAAPLIAWLQAHSWLLQ